MTKLQRQIFGFTAEQLKSIFASLAEMEIEVCRFFHKITHLITSKHCVESAEKKNTTKEKLFRNRSSRGALFLAKALENKSDFCSIFDTAKKFGTIIVLIEAERSS